MKDSQRKAMMANLGLRNKIKHSHDPSHGYYKVPNSTLDKLGIRGKITQYSKKGKESTHLEEDQDMTTFTKALALKGIKLTERDFQDKYYDDPNKNPARPFR